MITIIHIKILVEMSKMDVDYFNFPQLSPTNQKLLKTSLSNVTVYTNIKNRTIASLTADR